MPIVGGLQSFATVRRMIAGIEAMLWVKIGFAAECVVRAQSDPLA